MEPIDADRARMYALRWREMSDSALLQPIVETRQGTLEVERMNSRSYNTPHSPYCHWVQKTISMSNCQRGNGWGGATTVQSSSHLAKTAHQVTRATWISPRNCARAASTRDQLRSCFARAGKSTGKQKLNQIHRQSLWEVKTLKISV